MPAPLSIDRDTFLGYLRDSRLVEGEALRALAKRHADKARGRALARALVADGVLTRFQAERLLNGRTAGFLLGPYRVLDQLGRGGMGRVYKAEHRTMGRLVALKVLAPDLLKTERAKQLFLHEIRAVGQLVHPNIVTAYDANEAGGRHYLVLEYVDGPNLDELIQRQGPLSPGLAADYVRQAATGLQCAYQIGMLHRDVKPANILVQRHGANGPDSPGLVKVSDFGLARLSPTAAQSGPGTILTRPNAVMGTPDYLSPEQARSLHQTDIRGDVYSLGCTFYYLLTGQVPFPGGTALDKMIRHATQRPAAVPKFRSDVPAPLLVVLERMIAKEPADRPQTPAEVAELLAPFAVSGPTPWAAPPAAADDAVALVPGSDADVALDDDDLSALSVTLKAGLADTVGVERPSGRPRRPDAGAQLGVALLTAVGVVLGALAVVAGVAWLVGR